MTHSIDNLQNAILCDDIREEVGNKLSLMGIFTGDILVAEFPAQLQLAIFIQYVPSPEEDDGSFTVEVELFQNETRIVAGKINIATVNKQPAAILLPKGITVFENECMFRVVASIEDQKKEMVRKKISKSDLLKSSRS